MYGGHLKKKALFSHSLFETEASHGLCVVSQLYIMVCLYAFLVRKWP